MRLVINLNIQLLPPFSQAQYQGADKVRQLIPASSSDRRRERSKTFLRRLAPVEPIFQQQRSHLIDSGGTFDDETLTDAMSRLQCQLS